MITKNENIEINIINLKKKISPSSNFAKLINKII